MHAAGLGRRLAGFAVLPGARLRVYGLTDFIPGHFPMLRLLSKTYKLDVISKTLWMGNRKWLRKVAKLPGSNVSLSFNRAVPGAVKRLAECQAFVKKEKLRNVSFNWTFTTDFRKTGRSEIEGLRRLPGVSVYHTTQMSKEPLRKAIGDRGVCGIFGEDGKRIDTGKGKGKGSCRRCGFCRGCGGRR